jgi:hypothetical protein
MVASRIGGGALNDVMAEWSDFYTLIGATAGTLIGLIFVVVSLGADTLRPATNIAPVLA